MQTILLNKKNMNELYGGIELNEAMKRSVPKRNNNFQYVEDTARVQVKCSGCNEWHDLYEVQDGEWADVNETYWETKKGTTDNYFASKCDVCYNKSKGVSKVVDNKIVHLNKKGEVIIPKNSWSKFGNGKQKTVFITDENLQYMRLQMALNDVSINAFINHMIDEYRNDNPINL